MNVQREGLVGSDAPSPRPEGKEAQDSVNPRMYRRPSLGNDSLQSVSLNSNTASLHSAAEDNIQEMRKSLRSQSVVFKSESDNPFLSVGLCEKIMTSAFFVFSVHVLTFANAVQMGFEADYPEWKSIWRISEIVFTGGFLIEMVIKCCVLKLGYFRDRANCLDGFITVLAVLDLLLSNLQMGDGANLQSFSILRILRVLRLARIMKLVRGLKPVVLVIQGVMKTFATLCNVFTLLAVICYVFAIFFTEHLGKAPTADEYPGFSKLDEDIDQQSFMSTFNPYACFGSMTLSMMTLFNMATLSEWHEIVRPVALKQPLFVPLFFGFGVLVAFGVMNVMIGLIVDDVITESKKMDDDFAEMLLRAKMKNLEKIQELLGDLDADGDGTISIDELATAMETHPEFQELLKNIKLPAGWTPTELVAMLDTDANGILENAEFAKGFFRLLESDDFQQLCILQTGLNQVKHMIVAGNKEIKDEISAMNSEICSMKVAMSMRLSIEEPGIGKAGDMLAAKLGTKWETLPPATEMPTCKISIRPDSEVQAAIDPRVISNSFQTLLGRLAEEHCREVADLQTKIANLRQSQDQHPSAATIAKGIDGLTPPPDDIVADERANQSFLRYSLRDWSSLESAQLPASHVPAASRDIEPPSTNSELEFHRVSNCGPTANNKPFRAWLYQGIIKPCHWGNALA